MRHAHASVGTSLCQPHWQRAVKENPSKTSASQHLDQCFATPAFLSTNLPLSTAPPLASLARRSTSFRPPARPRAPAPARRPRADPYVSPEHPGEFSVGAAAGGALAGRLAGGPGCHTNRGLRERRWRGGRQRPRRGPGGRRSPARLFESARSILAVGRDLAGENGGLSRSEFAGRGLRRQTEPPRLRKRPMQSPIELPSRRRVCLHTVPGCATCRCNRSRGPRARPAIARLPRCEPGVSRRPHTRELLCTPASSGAWSHTPRRAEPTGRVACRGGVRGEAGGRRRWGPRWWWRGWWWRGWWWRGWWRRTRVRGLAGQSGVSMLCCSLLLQQHHH